MKIHAQARFFVRSGIKFVTICAFAIDFVAIIVYNTSKLIFGEERFDSPLLYNGSEKNGDQDKYR